MKTKTRHAPKKSLRGKLDAQLAQLETAQLVRRAADDEIAYFFKHALLQEAAYESLLKQDRKHLHLVVGEALEQLYPEQLDELAPLLARHFEAASDDQRALTYFVLAGERAMRQYAFPEVIAHYTSALALAPRAGAPLVKLYRARGLAYEGHGEYERARADQEAALVSARAAQDPRAEWQALIDLGKLWAERDYGKTGEYFQRAYDLARTLDDPALLAHSLNRSGNWYINIERPAEARRRHHEALTIFQQLDDRRGIAQTYDLLGMTHSLGGDLVEGDRYFRQAVALFRELDEPVDMASSLTTMALGSAEYQIRILAPAAASIADGQRNAEFALQIARETGWRSAETFASIALALCQEARGDFTHALDSARRSFEMAKEIGHRQWMTFAHVTLAQVYAGLQMPAEARQHLEVALAMGKEINSWLWVRMASGWLASLCIRENDLERAQSVLDASPAPDDPPQTAAQRLVYATRAELALARGEPARALEILDRLIASAANAKLDGSNIIGVSLLRGQALAALGNFAEAEAAFTAARAIANKQGALPLLWQLDAARGEFYRAQNRGADSDRAFAAARAIVDQLAEHIADEALRKNFEQGARGFF